MVQSSSKCLTDEQNPINRRHFIAMSTSSEDAVSQHIVKELYLNVFNQNDTAVDNIISKLKDKTKIKSWQIEFDDATCRKFLKKQTDLDSDKQTLLWIMKRIGIKPVVYNPAMALLALKYRKSTSVLLSCLFSKVTSNKERMNELPAESRQLDYGKFSKIVTILQRDCKLKLSDEMYPMIGNRFAKDLDNIIPFLEVFDMRGIEMNLLAKFGYGGDNFISHSELKSIADFQFSEATCKLVEALAANGAEMWPLSKCLSDDTLLKNEKMESKIMDSIINLLIATDVDGLNLSRLLKIDKNFNKVVESMGTDVINNNLEEFAGSMKWLIGLDRKHSKIDVFLKRLFNGKRRYIMMEKGKWMFLKGAHKRKRKQGRNCILTTLPKDIVCVIYYFAFPF